MQSQSARQSDNKTDKGVIAYKLQEDSLWVQFQNGTDRFKLHFFPDYNKQDKDDIEAVLHYYKGEEKEQSYCGSAIEMIQKVSEIVSVQPTHSVRQIAKQEIEDAAWDDFNKQNGVGVRGPNNPHMKAFIAGANWLASNLHVDNGWGDRNMKEALVCGVNMANSDKVEELLTPDEWLQQYKLTHYPVKD